MEQQLASFRAQHSAPERPKFTAPLLFLHGLWAGAWVWDEFVWAFSQRGWVCWAPDLLGSRDPRQIGHTSVDAYADDVATAATGLDAAPVVCGHDLGALLALLAAARVRPRALVLIAPLLPRGWTVAIRPPPPLLRFSVLPALLRGRPVRPPSLQLGQHFLFAGLPAATSEWLHQRLKPDSGYVARSLTRRRYAFPAELPTCPVFVVRGECDLMCPPEAANCLAGRVSLTRRTYAGVGHWPLNGTIGRRLIGDIHRWLVQTLGHPLLVPPDEDAQ